MTGSNQKPAQVLLSVRVLTSSIKTRTLSLRLDSVQHPWEWDGFTNMLGPSDKGHHPLDSNPKTTVWY